jgi:hypothetical protein
VRVKGQAVAAETAKPRPVFEETGDGALISGGGLALVLLLFTLGLLMVSASAVPPARVPWPAVAESLYLHRSDLTAVGIGTVILALLYLNVAVLL